MFWKMRLCAIALSIVTAQAAAAQSLTCTGGTALYNADYARLFTDFPLAAAAVEGCSSACENEPPDQRVGCFVAACGLSCLIVGMDDCVTYFRRKMEVDGFRDSVEAICEAEAAVAAAPAPPAAAPPAQPQPLSLPAPIDERAARKAFVATYLEGQADRYCYPLSGTVPLTSVDLRWTWTDTHRRLWVKEEYDPGQFTGFSLDLTLVEPTLDIVPARCEGGDIVYARLTCTEDCKQNYRPFFLRNMPYQTDPDSGVLEAPYGGTFDFVFATEADATAAAALMEQVIAAAQN